MINNSEKVIKSRRACADFRIQKSEDFAKISVSTRYVNFGPQESSIFRRLTHKLIKKKIGKAILEIGCEQLEAVNKGYPRGFFDYTTYDAKHNENYLKKIKGGRNN